MDNSTIAILISGAGLVVIVAERLWGGGNGLAMRFSALKETVNGDIAKLRSEMTDRIDSYDGQVSTTVATLQANIHRMELAAMEFRAVSAETYMRRDNYYKAAEEMKRDVSIAFDKIDKRLERMENTIARHHKEDRQA